MVARHQRLVGALILVSMAGGPSARAADLRRVISLDGTWDIAQGSKDQTPAKFDQQVIVPGLVDMARPAFADVGIKSPLRDAFWYRRTFRVEEDIPAVVILKIHKAMFGAKAIPHLEHGPPAGRFRRR